MANGMSARDMRMAIVGMIDELVENEDESGVFEDGCTPRSVQSFEEAMLLTGNEGLVVTLADGSSFQITIVRAR